MKLNCYALLPDPPKLAPARASREWMDDFPGRHAHRCLPMTIANTYGWEILSPCTFGIDWNGGDKAEDITFTPLDGNEYLDRFVQSNFTHGIVTMHTGYLFETDPGWNLFTSGPLNCAKDGITPLSGIVETNWLPYPFTMNWQLTRPGTVVFAKDEPFCLVFPVQEAYLEEIEPVIHNLADNPDLDRQYSTWRHHRDEFMSRYRAGDTATIKEAWQRYYFAGKYPDGAESPPSHRNKVRLNPPVDRRGRR